MRSLSLGTRLALIILAGTLITVGSVLLIAYRELIDDFETLLTEQQLQETRRISGEVNRTLQLRLDILSDTANTLTDGNSLLPLEEASTLIGNHRLLSSLFPGGILILDDQATAIAENAYVPNRIGTNYRDRPHIRQVIETRQPVISRPIMGRATGVPLIAFVAPIETYDGDLLGLLSGTINLDQTSIIPERLQKEASNNGIIFTVIDSNNFLYIEGGTESGSRIQPLPRPGVDPLIDAALSGMSFGRIYNMHGKEVIYASSHLQKLGWQFVRAVPYEWATAPAKESFLHFFWVSLAIAIVIALASFMLSRSATMKLDRMTQRIQHMVRNPSQAGRLPLDGPREVRNLAEAFNRLMDEQNAIATMKEHFVSNVSHELRTPLTSINGALRLIDSGAAGELPDQARNMASLALRNGERLQLLISDLLDFSKLSSGLMPVALQPEPLQPIIESAVAGNQAMAGEHGITLSGSCDPDLVLTVDALRLRQILDNFISNAIKFSPAQGRVIVRVEPGTWDYIRIIVQDNGEGVPQAFVSKLFDRFAQAEAGTTRSARGTGLGLAICQELATLMHGHLGYYYDQGAHFWVELPAAEQRTESDNENT